MGGSEFMSGLEQNFKKMGQKLTRDAIFSHILILEEIDTET